MSKPPSTESGLIIDTVSHAFGATTVVRAASISIEPGEIHCLLGPSGSGKTTLLRLVAGLERLQSGSIRILGQEVAGPDRHTPPEHRPIGFVFQDYALFPHLSVRDNVLFGMSKKARSRVERMRELLESVGMSPFEQAMPHTLSGGQQQRVALARALARDPQVMLLDEPFSGLDTALRDEVRQATVDVLRAANVATVMVTHDPQEAMLVGDTISIIHDGRIEQTGSPKELYSHPRNERVAVSLGEANYFRGEVRGGVVSTPVGEVDGAGFNDGDLVTVVVRPQTLRLSIQPTNSSVRVDVSSTRYLGEAVRFETTTACGAEVVVIASENSDVVAGGSVHLTLDRERAIVVQSDA